MTRHASARAIARYRAGMVSRRRATRIGQHLPGCARCSRLSSDLADLSVLLARADAPPMPDRLAERVQLALAAESASRTARSVAEFAGAPAAGGRADGIVQTPGRPGRPGLPERSGRGRRRIRMPDLTSPRLVRGLAVASAVLVLGSVGYVLANGASQQAVPGASKSQPSRIGVNHPQTGAAGRGGQFAGMRPLNYTLNGKPATTTATLASRENFTRGNMADKVRSLVAAARVGGPPGPAVQPGSTSSPAVATSPAGGASQAEPIGGTTLARLGGCLTRVAAGREVLVAEVARYLGKPAAIIVLRPLARAAAVLDVTVVALACSATDEHVIARTTVPAG